MCWLWVLQRAHEGRVHMYGPRTDGHLRDSEERILGIWLHARPGGGEGSASPEV